MMMIRRRFAACTILLASLMAVSGPAAAVVTMECKNKVGASGAVKATEAYAKADTESKWAQAVVSKYGHVWAFLSKAKVTSYSCSVVTNGWRCVLWARPCSQVTPPSSSSVTPILPRSGLSTPAP